MRTGKIGKGAKIMADKNSFILRNEYLDIFTDLSDSQAGVLIKAVYKYAAAKEMPEGLKDVEVKMAFKFIKKDIDYDTQKYNDLCEKRSLAGKKGGAPLGNDNANKQNKQMLENQAKQANAFLNKQNKHSDSDSVCDSELLDKSNNNNPLNISPLKVGNRFKKPSIDEIKAYCLERKNKVDPQRFFDFYESKGWKVGNSPMKDWKAAIRTWEQRNTLISAEKKQSERDAWRYPSPAGKYDV